MDMQFVLSRIKAVKDIVVTQGEILQEIRSIVEANRQDIHILREQVERLKK